MVFNCRERVLMCTTCRIAVRQAHARAHVNSHKDAHFRFPTQVKFDEACRRLGVRQEFPSFGTDIPSAIQGLPVHDVFRCGHCIHNVLLSARSMRQHYSGAHDTQSFAVDNLQTCKAQRWSNGGQDHGYFEVSPPVSEEEPVAEEEAIEALIEESAPAFVTQFGPARDNIQNQWDAAYGWPEWVRSVGFEEIRLRIETPKGDDLLVSLVPEMRKYLRNAEGLIYQTVGVIRRRFISPKPEK